MRPSFVFFLALMLFGATVATAQDSSGVRVVGSIYNGWNDIYSIAFHRDYALLAMGSYGLGVIDISNPAQPQEISFFDTPGEAECVAAAGNYAYVADGPAGLRVIDLTEPSQPREIGFCGLRDFAHSVAVAGNYAYIAAGGSGLRVIDVSGPERPTEVGSIDSLGFATELALFSHYAAVVSNESGLFIVDVSDPSAPRQVGFHDTPGIANGVAISGTNAFVTDHREGLRIVDISDPTRPRAIGYFETPKNAVDVAVAGNYAYVASLSDEMEEFPVILQALDISNPAAPREVWGSYPGEIYSVSVAVSGNYVYLGVFALNVIDVTEPTEPEDVARYSGSGMPISVALDGDVAFVADALAGMRIVDVSDPRQPREIGLYPFLWCSDVVVSGDFAYAASIFHLSLSAVNVSDPTDPREEGRCSLQDEAYSLAMAGDYVCVGEATCLEIVDVSRPAQLEAVGCIFTQASVWSVAVRGDYAFFSVSSNMSSSLRIADISNPAQSHEVGVYIPPQGFVTGVAVAGNYAYLGIVAEDFTLIIVDVSNPARPRGIAFCDIPGGAAGVAVAGNHAYTVNDNSWSVIDVSDPYNPQIAGFYERSHECYLHIAVGPDNLIYVPDGRNLRIYDASEARGVKSARTSVITSMLLNPAFPNPFNSQTTIVLDLPSLAPVRLVVTDPLGRQVRDLTQGSWLSAGKHQIVWNAAGLPSGEYFIQLNANGAIQSRSVNLTK